MAQRRRLDATAFGHALREHLAERGVQQMELAAATGVSPSYINRMMRGRKVSPEWADRVSDALKLDPSSRLELHAAAAQTWGFKLDTPTAPNRGSKLELDLTPKKGKG